MLAEWKKGWKYKSQSSSAKIKRQTSKFANGFGTSGKYSLMAFFTGFGMMLGSISADVSGRGIYPPPELNL